VANTPVTVHWRQIPITRAGVERVAGAFAENLA
jgi:hypothetical protein